MQCTASGVSAPADIQGLNDKQLLAALVSVLCQVMGLNCTAASLSAQSACLMCMTDKALLASAVYVLCVNGSASVGGTCIVGGTGAPVGTPPCNFSIYIQQPGPNFGLWLGDTVFGWSNVIPQGP